MVSSRREATTDHDQGSSRDRGCGRARSAGIEQLPCDVLSITNNDPYAEIVRYLKRNRESAAAAFATLRYFDGAILARYATTPALFSVALMDATCPPSTVYAAFNRWGCADTSIEIYEFDEHEGGDEHHQVREYEWLEHLFGRARLARG